MSEQRFTFDYEVEFEIFDRVTKKHYDGAVGCQEKICDLLNEQQATINELKERNAHNFAKKMQLMKENEQLRQQRQEYKENWDDMVELATKTSRRNVELDEEIGRLQRENEQLRHELDSLSGCYCADNKEFKDYWRIGYDD